MIIPKFIIDQNIINDELNILNNILNQQRQLKQTLLLYLEKISDGIYNANNQTDSTSLISCLNGIKKSFDNIKNNIDKICELKKYLENFSNLSTYDSSYFEKYNKEYLEIFEKISNDNIFYYSFMESLLKYMNVIFPETNSTFNIATPHSDNISKKIAGSSNSKSNLKQISNIKKIKKSKFSKNKTNSLLVNNLKENININNEDFSEEKTLIVSEKNQNVILPYSTLELEKCFSDNPEKYNSIQDIIDKEYTIPLQKYKNQSLARFREGFNLARNKSNLSFHKSLSLANELFFNSNLDPAIITACKNTTELYVYLSCLEDNVLHEFKCFKIVYDLA